ncbi:AhpA/YtjB family protein, partial [Pseudomonas aeruginosa]|uniref:AhpA/YtjB family protein n=1 Tax=Pseudomonas aeruginosa TaxID=287 RepID=UPI003D18E7D8
MTDHGRIRSWLKHEEGWCDENYITGYLAFRSGFFNHCRRCRENLNPTKLKFRLHRAVIVLFCLALLVALMQGASWFSQNHQRQRNPQLEEL